MLLYNINTHVMINRSMKLIKINKNEVWARKLGAPWGPVKMADLTPKTAFLGLF